MFNALKKLVGSHETNASKNQPPPGVQAMGQSLQRKFAKGIQYNMKIIIKGDRNVGKSCLFLRLQGQKFKEEYIPTEEIQVASIQWNYKATDDVVKVEIWDVVDKGKKRKKIEGLKIDNKIPEQVPEEAALDAEFIDVYKGTNGVIMVLDITKQWTFAYVQRELPLVPHHVPVLVLANHRDMGHHHTVSEDQIKFFIDSIQRPKGSAQIRYAEGSMRNGFGLKFLHKFFNLPFLQLQKETLLKQLEINNNEIEATIDELDCLAESEEQNYDVFLENLTNHRRQVAEQLSRVPSSASVESVNAFSLSQANGISPGAKESQNNVCHPSTGVNKSVSMPVNLCKSASGDFTSQVSISTPSPVLLPAQDVPKPERSFISKILNKSSSPSNQNSTNSRQEKDKAVILPVQMPPASLDSSVRSVEDFVPEDTNRSLNSFLEESPAKHALDVDAPVEAQQEESESDGEVGNPMVTGYQDDLDPEDAVSPSFVEAEQELHSVQEASGDDEPKISFTVKAASAAQDAKTSDTTVNSSARDVHNPSIVEEEEDEEFIPKLQNEVRYSLENEDLSVLEHMYNGRKTSSGTSSIHSRSSPSATGSEAVSEDSSTTRSKKHKHKNRNKEEEKMHRKSHKHKKHREKDSSENKEKIAKKKKHKIGGAGDMDSSSDVDKLEEFLGSDNTTERQGNNEYEIL